MRRRCSIDGYIPGFYIHTYQLVVEVDGKSYFTPKSRIYDAERTAVYESIGLWLIRLTNHEDLHQFEAVCETIKQVFAEPKRASPPRRGVTK